VAAATVLVEKPGLLTTIQDLGRWGHQHLGVPVAGPMDAYSHRLANRLVGNREDAAVLEVSVVGPDLLFEGDVTFAVAGASFPLTLDRATVPTHTACCARRGNRLRFGLRECGARAYLAVAGGFDVPIVMGSRATSLACRMGPLGGRPVRTGDRLAVGAVRRHAVGRRVRQPLPLPDGGATVRVLWGPQTEAFTDAARDTLVSVRFEITTEANRMGFRLRGPALAHRTLADLLSEATPMGSIQVPASGQPILLMADRQTTGGYPKIATVISADLPLAGQLGVGDWIAFVPCSVTEARRAWRDLEERLGEGDS
jgi:antagonist of KipI